MSHALHPSKRPDIAAIEAAAVAEGRHSREFKRLCGGCDQWVSEIWYVTLDRRRLCPDCADKIGQGPKALEAKMNRPGAFERSVQ